METMLELMELSCDEMFDDDELFDRLELTILAIGYQLGIITKDTNGDN